MDIFLIFMFKPDLFLKFWDPEYFLENRDIPTAPTQESNGPCLYYINCIEENFTGIDEIGLHMYGNTLYFFIYDSMDVIFLH